MSRPWIEIQRELYTLISPIINFQIYCADYSVNGQSGSTELLRYWITLDEEIVWDFPAQFICMDGMITSKSDRKTWDRYTADALNIPEMICKYIDTPEDKIFPSIYDDEQDDCWGLIDIFRAADRRFGISRKDNPNRNKNSIAVNKVLDARLKASERYSFGYEFCLYLEYRLSFILENCITDAEKSGFWCDGVIFDCMIDNNTAFCRAWIVKGKTEWHKFYLILHLGKTSALLLGRTDFPYLKERVCSAVQPDSFSIDITQKTIHFILN